MRTNLVQMINVVKKSFNLNRTSSLLTTLVLLFTLGIGNAWAGSASTQGGAYLKVGSPTGSGKVYVAANNATAPTNNQYVNCTTSGTTIDGTSGKSQKSTFYFYAKANSGYKFTGWYKKNSDDTYTLVTTNASWSGSVTSPASEPTVGTSYTYLNRYAEFIKVVSYSFVVPEHGSFTVTNNGTSMPAYETFEAEGIVHAVATPVEGYRFGGWYTTTDGGTTRNYFSYTAETDLSFSDDATVGADFRPDNGKALFHVINGGLYENLNTATTEASTVSPKVVVVAQDGLLSAGSYNIPSGVTLLVPYNSANLVQTEPTIINKDLALKAYKKLTFADGANISVSGVICVGGQIMSASGGNPSGYTTGACGVIDMSQGGHIELKSGATLYAWGFITGQDLNQGNNTVGAGTITAKNGSKVWENLAFGDWRGGTACSSIANTRFFPFQSYFVQNIEVQLSVEFGAEEKCYSVVNASSSDHDVSATLIGQSSSLFKLTDANSIVCKWYDATTDLMCYELQGTANFDAIVVSGLPVIQSISSEDFDLPISSNMHIILSNSNVTLNKDMVMQPGSKIEIKSGSSITVSAKVYLYDKDDWGAYAGPDYYFHNYGNANGIFTSHKNRGNGTSKNGLDDAQFIVDGTLTVTGKLYTTTHGADIMGNGGGKVIFSASLPDATTIPAFTSNGNAVSGGVAVTAANLCNEDGTYTKSIGSSTFHNNWGRWFIAADKDERANHTYAFKYMANGNSGDDVPTDAVYAPDKTGLTAGMKWCNVAQDATCSNIYNATQALNETPASDIRYTYPTDSWLQLLRTETEGVYGGSDNSLYALDGCAVNSLGSVDENCLYTIDEVKKALVDAHFVALEKNTEDEAWHDVANPTNYYISFAGCTWHPATKYAGEEKAYIVEEGDYIWYNNDWLLVEREDPFFFDYNEQNVKRYYEYLNDEWVLATPYVEVEDAIETREFFLLSDALTVASGKTNATITILRDMPSVTTTASFTGASKTCTLDLNGHKVTGSATKVINVNASGCTFIIKDSQGGGELKSTSSTNALAATVYVTKGTVTLQSGTVSITSASTGTEDAKCQTAIYVAAGAKLNMSNGTVNATRTAASGSYCYGVFCETDGTGGGAVDITGGTISASFANGTYIFGVHVSGTSSIKNASISATGKGTLYAVSERTSAKLTLENVTATGAATQGTARGVIPRSTCTIKSGTYTATAGADKCDALYLSNGTTTIEGGTFISNGTSTVNALSVNNSGRTLIVKGGTFTATGTTSAYGISVAAGNTATVNGGIFTVNTTATGESTAIGIQSNGTTTVSAGTFNVTAANFKAWGIDVAAGTTTVTGGSFTATASTEQAHGTYIRNGAKLIVSGTSSFKGKLTNVKEGGWSTGSQVLGGGTLEVTGGSFIAESAKSGLSGKQKSYAVGVYANTNATNGGSHVSIANATLRGELKSTYLTNGGASEWAGGAYGLYSKTANDLTLTNCTIQAVSAYQGGFGIRLLNTPAEIHDCTVTINTTYAYNYGIFTDGTADAKVYNSSFTATSGTTYAYGAYVYGGSLTAEDCEFNSTTNQTGASAVADCNLYGIKVNTGKSAALTGCTVRATGNTSYSNNGYGVYVDGTANLDNCNVTVSNINDGAYALYNTSNTTLLNVASGKYKATATSNAASTNGTAAAAKQTLNGGYYSHDANLSKYVATGYSAKALSESHTEYPNGYRYEINNLFNLTWDADGGTISGGGYTQGTVAYGTIITPPENANVTRENYIFNGWDVDIAATMPAQDVTYTAQWIPIVASVTPDGGEETKYTSWTEALAAANNNEGCTLKLLNDVSGLTTSQEITKSITFDLNGYTISGTLSAVGGLLKLNTTNKTLTIKDSKTNGTISVTGNIDGRISAVDIQKGTLVIQSGNLVAENANTGTTKANIYVAAVYLKSSTSLTMSGGHITGRRIGTSGDYCFGVYCAGTGSSASHVNMTSGEVTALFTNGRYAEGIYAAGNSTISNMTVTGTCKSLAYALRTEDGLLTVNGGTYTATTTEGSARGILAVKATLLDGVFTAHAGTDNSAAVYCYGNTITIDGGTYNASADGSIVYGIYMYNNSKSTMVYVNGGTFNASGVSDVHGVNVLSSSKLTTTGGTFNATASGTIATVRAYGLSMLENGTANLSGATFFGKTTGNATIGAGDDGSTAISSGNAYPNGAYGIIQNVGVLTLENCTIKAEAQKQYANALYTKQSVTIDESVLEAKTNADMRAHAIYYNGSGKTLTLTNSSFSADAKTKYAYAIYDLMGNINSTNCTYYAITRHTDAANCVGRGIYHTGTSTVTLNGDHITVEGSTSKSKNAYGLYSNSANARAIVNDATIDVTNVNSGYPLYVESSGNQTINSGKFKGKTASLQTNSPGTIQLKGGYYSHNTLLSNYCSAPYYVLSTTAADKELVGSAYNYKIVERYIVQFNNYEGTELQSGLVEAGTIPVYSGETPTKAADAQYTYTHNGWNDGTTSYSLETPLPSVSAAATYTATYSSTVNKYEITWKDGDGNTLKTETVAYGTTPSYSGATPTKTEDEDYTYTFNDTWSPEIAAVTGNATYTAQFDAASKETGFYVDIVDVDNTSKTLTLNVTGWASGGWGSTGYVVNGTSYLKTDREEDRTLIIPYTGDAGESFSITVVNASGETVSKHNYIIPTEISTDANLGAQQMVYVKNNATLTVNTTTTVQNIYVAPGAKLVVNEDVTLTADTVFLRTTPWASAELENNGTLTGQLCYTRIIKDQSQYYQFGLPFSCDINTVRLSDGSTPTYNSAWLLRSYSENKRAEGGAGDNWETLVANKEGNIIIAGGVGYEMFSASKYYREYYFPVTLSESNTVSVSYTENGKAGEQHAGWNILTSPLTSQYTVEPMPEGWVINWLQEDGTYSQEPANIIRPAIPFSYQAKATGTITFGSELIIPSLASRRRAESTEETIRIQWIHLDVQDADNVGDETSIYSHPTRYEEAYKTGIDVAKQSFEATRALLYSSHAYGEMAFAGVSDELLERGIPLTLYSPAEQKLTISMRENNWLNRLAFVWLIDKETGARTDLLMNDYRFLAPQGTTTGRFFIQGQFFAPQITTDIQNDGTILEGTKIKKVLINDKMYIQVNDKLYEATGKLVISNK